MKLYNRLKWLLLLIVLILLPPMPTEVGSCRSVQYKMKMLAVTIKAIFPRIAFI